MSKHTEGPWNVCEPVGWIPQGRHWTAEQMMDMWWVGKRPGVAVALIDGSTEGREEAEANARLIAAAPELLSELLKLIAANDRARTAEDNWIRSGNDEATGMEFEDAVATVIICEHSARAIIAKANGE